MFWTVYRLRDRGLRLPKEEVQRQPVVGTFRYYARMKREGWESIMLAVLMRENGDYVVPCLDGARVLQVTPKGLLVTGTELHPLSRSYKSLKFQRYRQTWWCIPHAGAHADQASHHSQSFAGIAETRD